jgi:peptidylprolyl isomerase domain and WD repeat-containing protein 1
MIEYWCPSTLAPAAPPTVAFTLKLDTDLYALAKAGAVAHCLEVSPDGEKFVAVADDRQASAGCSGCGVGVWCGVMWRGVKSSA